MTRTLVDIPDDLMEEARAVVGPNATKVETVTRSLREMVQRHRQLENIAWLAEADPLASLRDPEVRAGARG